MCDANPQCVQNKRAELQQEAAPDSLYQQGIYDNQTATAACVEGFGCPRVNQNKFLVILLVVAVLAYYASTKKGEVVQMGGMLSSVVSAVPRASDAVRGILNRW